MLCFNRQSGRHRSGRRCVRARTEPPEVRPTLARVWPRRLECSNSIGFVPCLQCSIHFLAKDPLVHPSVLTHDPRADPGPGRSRIRIASGNKFFSWVRRILGNPSGDCHRLLKGWHLQPHRRLCCAPRIRLNLTHPPRLHRALNTKVLLKVASQVGHSRAIRITTPDPVHRQRRLSADVADHGWLDTRPRRGATRSPDARRRATRNARVGRGRNHRLPDLGQRLDGIFTRANLDGQLRKVLPGQEFLYRLIGILSPSFWLRFPPSTRSERGRGVTHANRPSDPATRKGRSALFGRFLLSPEGR